MRTSRISQDTSKILSSTSSSPRRSTRSSLARFALNANQSNPKEETDGSADIEDAIIAPSSSRKRKHEGSIVSQMRASQRTKVKVEVKTEIEDSVKLSPSPIKERKVRKPARKIKNEETGEVEIHPPNNWRTVYDMVMAMRKTGSARNAAVDTMGCETYNGTQEDVTPRDKRYHTLTSLMLSSQTKDTTNAMTMDRLQKELPACKEGAPTGLNIENILAVDPKLLNEIIWAVGFHNNKTKYIKATAEILRDQWNSDIPDTIEGLVALPGVGPKMGYLCLSAAWGRDEGIGVDVHVHRITNLWGWHKTKNPEETRLALQGWLPKELWHEINWLLVGFGQTVCAPVGRKCGDCELGMQGLCKAADRAKVTIGRKLREEVVMKDEGDAVLEKGEIVKQEDIVDNVPVPIEVAAELEKQRKAGKS